MFGDILVGLLLLAIGLIVCFAGLRAFFVVLPVVGFITGFYIGAAGTQAVLGGSFLGTVTSVIVAIVVGIVLAVLSYLLWYVGALIGAGSTGALIGSGVMHAFGATEGWVVFIGAATGAILLFAIAFKLALPVYVVIVNTAFVGAAGAIAGLMLLFNRIDLDELGYGMAWAAIQDSWFWLIGWSIVAVIGLFAQLQMIATIKLPEDRWSSTQPA